MTGIRRRCAPCEKRSSLPSVLESLVKSPRRFTVIIERDEDGYYVATVPALRGCHTQAKNLDTLMKRVREVVQLCIEDNRGGTPLELVGIQQISV